MATYNNTYRGYLQQQADQGNSLAQLGLNFQGDDGGINSNAINSYYDSPMGDRSAERDATSSQLSNLYSQYSHPQTSSVAGGGTDYSGQLSGLDASEQRLRSLLGTADVRLDQGLGQLQDSYDQESGKANLDRTRALENYGTQREDATSKKNSALDKVDTNARTLNDSLRRILGLASGSGSSAFQFAAPNAVAREATRQRQGVLNDSGTDFRNLDTAEGRAKVDFDSVLQNLSNQRKSKEQELREGILGQKQQIDTQLGDIASQRSAFQGGGVGAQVAAAQPFADSYDSRQNEINALFNQFRPQITAQAVNPQQVSLSNYTTDPAAVNANQQYGTDEYSPYAQLLRRQREQQA